VRALFVIFNVCCFCIYFVNTASLHTNFIEIELFVYTEMSAILNFTIFIMWRACDYCFLSPKFALIAQYTISQKCRLGLNDVRNFWQTVSWKP